MCVLNFNCVNFENVSPSRSRYNRKFIRITTTATAGAPLINSDGHRAINAHVKYRCTGTGVIVRRETLNGSRVGNVKSNAGKKIIIKPEKTHRGLYRTGYLVGIVFLRIHHAAIKSYRRTTFPNAERRTGARVGRVFFEWRNRRGAFLGLLFRAVHLKTKPARTCSGAGGYGYP